jgi:transcriptional regulator with XRE-family HTH domain
MTPVWKRAGDHGKLIAIMESGLMGHLTSNTIFGKFFRLRRVAAGLTQQELADVCNCAVSEISKIERGRKHAPHQVIERADEATGDDGDLVGMYDDLPWEDVKEGFQEYRRREVNATELRFYEPMVVHGLLQTADYTRALVTGAQPNAKPDVVEDLIADRMDRKEIFARDDPPKLMIVLDESGLRRCLGGPDVHRAQLDVLIEVAQRPYVIIRVIPLRAPICVGMNSAFGILSFDEGRDVAYSEDPAVGRLTDDPERVARYVAEFNAVSVYALPVDASLRLLEQIREEI